MEELKAKHAKELAKMEVEIGICEMLPDSIPSPLVCNLDSDPGPTEPHGWISFSAPAYDPNKKHNPVAILAALEAAGWKSAPCSLVRKAQYRRSPQIGLFDEMPEKIGRDPVTESDPIAPFWVIPNQFTACDFNAFMESPDGRVWRMSFDVPGLASISAKRVYPRGAEWYFERGSAKLHTPPHWHGLDGIDCGMSKWSGATVDTQQGISGWVYFDSFAHNQADYPHPLSTVLAALIAKA